MADIDVREESGAFRVTVTEGGSSTEHSVEITDTYLSKIELTDADRRRLIEESFSFLLEREPKESILRSFDLAVIERYFPEYPTDIRRRLA